MPTLLCLIRARHRAGGNPRLQDYKDPGTGSCCHSICPYVLAVGVIPNLPTLPSSTGEVSVHRLRRVHVPFGACRPLTTCGNKQNWQIFLWAFVAEATLIPSSAEADDNHPRTAPALWRGLTTSWGRISPGCHLLPTPGSRVIPGSGNPGHHHEVTIRVHRAVHNTT